MLLLFIFIERDVLIFVGTVGFLIILLVNTNIKPPNKIKMYIG